MFAFIFYFRPSLQTRKVILTLIQLFSTLDKGCNNVRITFLVYREIWPHGAVLMLFFMTAGRRKDKDSQSLGKSPQSPGKKLDYSKLKQKLNLQARSHNFIQLDIR